MTCLVVASNPDVRLSIAALLASEGVEAICLASLGELIAALIAKPASGILVEVVTSMKASSLEKAAVQEIFHVYPMAKFKWVEGSILLLGRTKSLAAFVEECRDFAPRLLRREPRRTVYVAASLGADASLREAEKSITIKVASRGCFIFSARPWQVGQRVWMRFQGHEEIVAGTVRSFDAWGAGAATPGIGIEFDEPLALEL